MHHCSEEHHSDKMYTAEYSAESSDEHYLKKYTAEYSEKCSAQRSESTPLKSIEHNKIYGIQQVI